MKKLILPALLLLSQWCTAKSTLLITFTHDSLTINARLQIPDGGGRFPVIIINPGTGGNDKDGTAVMSGANPACLYPGLLNDTLRPYRGLSEALSDSGYAVLTYDKIEYTYPMVSPITFHKLWLPVESALAYVKTRSDIDTTQIVLLGHSEGSTLVPYIARMQTGVKALISLAGPRTPLDSMLAYQLVYIAQTCNGNVAMATAQGNQVLQYFGQVRAGTYTSSTPALFGVQPGVWEDYIHVADSVAINYNLANKPTLFVGLESDFNVPVATELTRFQNEITIPADFYSLPNLNHFMTTPNDPAVAEVVTDTIIYWLRGQNIIPTSVPAVAGNTASISVVLNTGRVLSISSGDSLREVSIINMEGKLVMNHKLTGNNSKLDMKQYPAGVYVVDVTVRSGRKSFKIALP